MLHNYRGQITKPQMLGCLRASISPLSNPGGSPFQLPLSLEGSVWLSIYWPAGPSGSLLGLPPTHHKRVMEAGSAFGSSERGRGSRDAGIRRTGTRAFFLRGSDEAGVIRVAPAPEGPFKTEERPIQSRGW